MPYISTEEVKAIREKIKKEFPSYKFSIYRKDHMSIHVHLMQSDLSFKRKHDQVNHYWIKDHYQDNPKAQKVLMRIHELICGIKPNYDRNFNDPGADYGDRNYFIEMAIGKWDQPHICTLPAVV
jgi:hypothetical protein